MRGTFGSAEAPEEQGGVINSSPTNKDDVFPRVIHSSAWIIKVYVCSMSLRMATLLAERYSRQENSATKQEHKKAQNRRGLQCPLQVRPIVLARLNFETAGTGNEG